jgi:hypothetical protein
MPKKIRKKIDLLIYLLESSSVAENNIATDTVMVRTIDDEINRGIITNKIINLVKEL